MAIVVNDRERIGEEKLGVLFDGGKVRRRREWRGLRDTLYDYGRWLYILSILAGGHRKAAQREGHVPLQAVCKLPRRAAHAR